jgi:peroxiredoxin
MARRPLFIGTVLFVTGSLLVGIPAAHAQSQPTVAQALQLKPLQADVDQDLPTGAEAEKCTIRSEVNDDISGWIVLDDMGRTLRRFLDTNRDNRVDLWCYYKQGIEIYRDIDADFNGKADQYRWLSTAGTRWGLDQDEDGRIDSWKMISPEEVTAEVVAALRDRDRARFLRLLPTAAELESLGQGSERQAELEKRINEAKEGFDQLVSSQKVVHSNSKWLQFGASRPGVLPEGTDGSTRDLLIYDNVAAIVETNGKHGQLVVGTLISVGSSWRAVDLPSTEAGEGLIYASMMSPRSVETSEQPAEMDAQTQDLLKDLEQVDRSIATATPQQRTQLHAKRADLLQQMIDQAANDEERQTWVRQFADMTSAAVQANEYPEGLKRLKTLVDQLAGDSTAEPLVPYVQFRFMTADYGAQLMEPNADFAKVQDQWLKDLESFIGKHPRVEETAEAMLQLAIALEFAGREEDALKWYGRIGSEFADAPLAAKAAGAKRRLESVGKSIPLQGKTVTGTAVNLASFRGRVVLVHYWATWCEPCKDDLQQLKALQAKFAQRGFSLIGVSLDSDVQALQSYIQSQQLSWPQLYEAGGLDSPLANEMGILTLPTMILVDKTGHVVRRNMHVGELEKELEKLLQ